MQEAIVTAGPSVTIQDSPVPEFNDDQLLIKVVVSGSNPKDWKLPEWLNLPGNTGDDIAGIVEKVGANVTEFKPGDRVFAFHEMTKPGGSFAEYAVAWQHTTAHLPPNTSFEQGATVPLAALTAAVGLYRHLHLPQPWTPARQATPLVIYGAASAVGIYTVQLAKLAGIAPLICIAGKSIAHVQSFLEPEKGDVIIDYRDGSDAIVEGIKQAANGRQLLHAYDAVSEHGSWENLGKALSPGATITTVLATKHEEVLPSSITISRTMVGSVHEEDKDLGFVYMRYFARGLQNGFFKPQPHEVVPGGLNGVQQGLQNLKDGKANAVKYVFKIAETS